MSDWNYCRGRLFAQRVLLFSTQVFDRLDGLRWTTKACVKPAQPAGPAIRWQQDTAYCRPDYAHFPGFLRLEDSLIESSGPRVRDRLFDKVTVSANATYSVVHAYPDRRAAKLKTIHRHLFR